MTTNKLEVNAKMCLFVSKLLQKYAQAKQLQLTETQLQVLFGELHTVLTTDGTVGELLTFANYLYNEVEVKNYLAKVDTVLSFTKDVVNK